MTLASITPTLIRNPDRISLVMAGLALFMTLNTALYASGYRVSAKRYPTTLFWCGLWAFGVSACLTALAADWFFFTVFLELSSVALFMMILAGDPETALMYLITQLAGAGLLLVGVALLFLDTGSLAFGPIPDRALPFFLLGLGVKAALPGLHFWLPRTHSVAPTPASALLSGLAVKLGIFGLMRLTTPETGGLFLLLGPVMALYGAAQALLQSDAKRLLAFSTFSQLGFILSALGTGTEAGITAALFYSVAHCLFKGLLFCSTGILEKSYGTRNLHLLGRTAPDSPLSFALFLVGALAISGVPGTSGFIAKSLTKEALKAGHHPLAAWVLLLATIGTTLSFCRMGYYGYVREKRSPSGKPHGPVKQVAARCHTATGFLAVATLALGILPLFSPHMGPEQSGSWLDWKNLLPGLLPILGGISLFCLLPGRFAPLSADVPDLYDLLRKTRRLFDLSSNLLVGAHNGQLRLYLSILLAATVTLFALLR